MVLTTVLVMRTNFSTSANVRTGDTSTEPLGDKNVTVKEQTEENNVSESEKSAIIKHVFPVFPS